MDEGDKHFFKCKPPEVHFTIRNRVPYNKLLTNRASSGQTGEYWPSVVFVPTSLRSVRTVTTSGQYSPVRPSRSVSKRLIMFFKITLGGGGTCFFFFLSLFFLGVNMKKKMFQMARGFLSTRGIQEPCTTKQLILDKLHPLIYIFGSHFCESTLENLKSFNVPGKSSV